MSIIDFTTAQRQYYNMTPHDDDDDQIIFAFLMGMKMTVGFTVEACHTGTAGYLFINSVRG